jgi:ribosome-interacting GTPase 1
VYTKEPGKKATDEPMILKENSTVKNSAEKILKGMSKKIKQTRIWGPSSKFGGQSVGVEHILKDKDVVEFKTK